MSIDRHISSTQVIWAIGLLLGLLLAAFLGTAVGNQDLSKVVLVFGAGATISVFLFLGNNYWMLIPLSLGAMKMPTVPLGGRSLEFPELAIVGCSIMFLVRIATRKDKLHLWQSVNLPFLLFMLWVCMVFVINPVGLAMLGSSTGGARFYLKIALAFGAFVILSNRTYTERDIRWVIGFIIFGAFFSLFYGVTNYILVGPEIDAATGLQKEEFYTWHQELAIPAFTITFLIFARYSPRQVFGIQKPWLIVVYLLCMLAVLLSGKRLATIGMLTAPLVSAVMYRQYIYVLVALTFVLGSMTLVVTGQGQWFRLPLVAQRTLSWLPGDWDPELGAIRGGTDEWRAELRYTAMEKIKHNPIIGRGYAVDIQDVITAISVQQRGGDMEQQVAAYAIGSAWHNTWLGYAADFGIPLSIIQASIYIFMMILCAKCFRYYGGQNMFGFFALYVFIYTIRSLINTHTGGHSAMDAWQQWWAYGIIVAIYLQMQAKKAQNRPASYARPPAASH